MFKDNFITAVQYDQLHLVFNTNILFDKTDQFKYYPHHWNLELGDVYYLIYILQRVNPNRHLEFGTSLGTSTYATLVSTKATVWTLNILLKNENNDYFFYNSEVLKNWANSFGFEPLQQGINGNSPLIIGYRYLAEDLGHRVNQIYCDSRKWDPTSVYSNDFFDSVFIDGGHQEEIVINDTLKALSVLKSGGMMIWHDFNLEALEKDPFKSVFNALVSIKDELYKNFDTLYWIYPSYLLFGFKK